MQFKYIAIWFRIYVLVYCLQCFRIVILLLYFRVSAIVGMLQTVGGKSE